MFGKTYQFNLYRISLLLKKSIMIIAKNIFKKSIILIIIIIIIIIIITNKIQTILFKITKIIQFKE